ncbi:tRNA pseudouridine(55) synthase TruB [Geomonas azotofigens]|uniref:tRNA pseudouridine(55) synthase TruB n=1 Tax=Geomonas azotofigens TaxID=2843196 RepID=UPI001C0FD1B3|nr:tRNA pseudouridine(55) synthase TruB [Geomonas azotofigens]MBU5614833.1 tRNA pseudouridine(55) synthase TruB [Geomonas azotofigens]
MNGFFVIDKPAGVTSHDIVSKVRRAINQKKVGHTGTLDPFATGVLPVAVGEGTKAIQFLDESEKEYRAVLRLGVATDTQDLTGAVISEREWSHITPADLEQLVPQFLGLQKQLPPMFSAIKQGGVPLYKLARKGIEVEREAREVEIHALTFEWIRLPEACFTVRCSRGTYVRTLACDIGEALGCGAHLLELRRTRSGLFREADAISIETLAGAADQQELLMPLDRALGHLKALSLTEAGGKKVLNGVVPQSHDFVDPPGAFSQGEQVRLYLGERFAAVAEYDKLKGLRLARVFN